MEYVRVDLMLFQQNLNTACVQGLLWLSLQPPKWEPSPSPCCWIRREWKNPSSQVSSYLLRERKRAAESVHLTWGAWQLCVCSRVKYSKIWNLLMPHLLTQHQGQRRGCSFSPGIPQGQAANSKGLSSRWAGLQVLLSSQDRKGGGFPSFSCQSLAPAPDQSSSLKVSQNTQRPSQKWSFQHSQCGPK